MRESTSKLQASQSPFSASSPAIEGGEKPGSIYAAACLTLACLAALYFAMDALVPVILSIFVCFLLDPVILWLERKKVSRIVSAPTLVLLVLFLSYCVGWGIYGSVAGLAEQLPRYSGKIRGMVSSFEGKAAEIATGTQSFMPEPASPAGSQKVEVVSGSSTDSDLARTVLHGVNSVFAVAADLLLIPILSVFLLLDRNYLKVQLERAVGPAFPLGRVAREASLMVRGYFIGNLVVGFLASCGFYVLFVALRLDRSLPLALFAGFVNLIPLFGALLGAVLPAVQAFLQFGSSTPVVIIIVSSVLLHLVVNNLVIPKLVGSRINVNATAAMLGLILWGWLWGVLGLLLAVPLMALLRIGLSSRPKTQAWANLIAEIPYDSSLLSR